MSSSSLVDRPRPSSLSENFSGFSIRLSGSRRRHLRLNLLVASETNFPWCLISPPACTSNFNTLDRGRPISQLLFTVYPMLLFFLL